VSPTPLPALEAVIFDAGGTLVRLDFEWMAVALTQSGVRADAATLRRAEVDGRRRYDQSGAEPGAGGPLGGRGDIRAYFGGMLMAAGVPAHHIEPTLIRFLAHEAASGLWSRPMEGARDAVDAIGRMGLRRAVVSNSDGRAERHLENAGVRDGIEFVVDSHRVQVEKPDPRIFRIALERLGTAAERALYVGDIRSVDEAGARAAGMHFVLIDPWGDYGAPGAPAIPNMGELPSWIVTHFEAPRRLVAAEPDQG
jgi:putative hydrolase of the HAD superfamily